MKPTALLVLASAATFAACNREQRAAADSTSRQPVARPSGLPPASVANTPPDSAHEMIVDSSVTSPEIRRVAGIPQLVLPLSFATALRAAQPDFAPLHRRDFERDALNSANDTSAASAAFGTVGDFDGDGRADVALIGARNRKSLILALLNEARGVRVVVVDSGGMIPGADTLHWNITVLQVHRPERVTISDYDDTPGKQPAPDAYFDLKHDGIDEEYYGKASTLWWWDGHRFRGILTSD